MRVCVCVCVFCFGVLCVVSGACVSAMLLCLSLWYGLNVFVWFVCDACVMMCGMRLCVVCVCVLLCLNVFVRFGCDSS